MDLERLVSDPVLIQITSLLTKLDLVVMEPSVSTYMLRLVVDRMEGKLEQWRKRLKVMQMRERMEDNSVRVIMHCEEIGVKKSNSASKPSLLKQCVSRPVQCENTPGVLQDNLEVEHVADIDDPPSAAEEEDIEDEIDIVVEEDGQIIKISPEELSKLRTEFEENRFLFVKEEDDTKERVVLEETEQEEQEEDERPMLEVKSEEDEEDGVDSRYNLDWRYAGKLDKSYLCKVCDLAMSSRRSLESHMGVFHPGLHVFRCNQCQKTFASDVGLILHIQNKHPKSSLKTLACGEPGCNYTTHAKQLLRTHKRQHTHNTVLQCPVCHKSYVGGTKAFRHHMQLHAGDKTHSCDQCDKSFVSKSRLTYHKSNVHNPPKFQCDTCSKLFRSKVNFTRHMSIHSSSRPHCCDICQTTFRTPGHLTSHVQTVHSLADFTAGRREKERKQERVARGTKHVVKERLGEVKEETIVEDRKPEEVLGHLEAEGYITSVAGDKKLCIKEMKAAEAERLLNTKKNNRGRSKIGSRKETLPLRKSKRKVSSKRFVPQIVTLTNEKGDLIKAIISVGGEEDDVERGETETVGKVSQLSGTINDEDTSKVDSTYTTTGGEDRILYESGVHHTDIVYVMET